MRMRPLPIAIALALSLTATTALAAGDPVKGKDVFATCAGCHVLSGPAFTAPPLAGVVGRKAGTAKGFDYSPAMAKAGITWTEQTLDAYLANPDKVVPGTAMFGGMLESAQDRADVIAYLKTVPAAH